MKFFIAALLCFVAAMYFMPIQEVRADLPVHCLWNETVGTWTLNLGDASYTRDEAMKNCGLNEKVAVTNTMKVTLSYPNIVKDEGGNNVGTWTMIWDQATEMIVNGVRYHAYFYYTTENGKAVSHCGQTFTGFYYKDNGPNTQNGYGCYFGNKNAQESVSKAIPLEKFSTTLVGEKLNDDVMINTINESPSTWTAAPYKKWEGLTTADLQRIGLGGRRVPRWRRLAIEQAMKQFKAESAKVMSSVAQVKLPQEIDWRNKSGQNYVSPVLNQGSCGSCYIFGTLGQGACRLRVKTNNQDQTTFSQQDVLNCADPNYAQGCEGGMQYTVAKFGYEMGFLPSKCLPYSAHGDSCPSYSNRWGCDAKPYYVQNYQYVGGYYGATNSQNMMESLVAKGPITVAFYVYPDFFHYRGGIYQHKATAAEQDPNVPFVDVNHSILIVGYGTKDGIPYWIGRNSWGETWGMSGYFMIRRGVDEVGIESCVVEYDL